MDKSLTELFRSDVPPPTLGPQAPFKSMRGLHNFFSFLYMNIFINSRVNMTNFFTTWKCQAYRIQKLKVKAFLGNHLKKYTTFLWKPNIFFSSSNTFTRLRLARITSLLVNQLLVTMRSSCDRIFKPWCYRIFIFFKLEFQSKKKVEISLNFQFRIQPFTRNVCIYVKR